MSISSLQNYYYSYYTCGITQLTTQQQHSMAVHDQCLVMEGSYQGTQWRQSSLSHSFQTDDKESIQACVAHREELTGLAKLLSIILYYRKINYYTAVTMVS